MSNEGLRFNEGKPRWSLIPTEWMEWMFGRNTVMTFTHAFLLSGDIESAIQFVLNETDQYSPRLALDVAEVMSNGAKKYTAHNWKKGFPDTLIVDSAMRHLYKLVVLGEETDDESGNTHIGHFIWNCLALKYQREVSGAGVRDLPVDSPNLKEIPPKSTEGVSL
jgi:hypothetical protein